MGDIEVLIKIPEEIYKNIQSKKFWLDSGLTLSNAYDFIRRGIPLPKGHGAIKDVSKIEIPICEDRTYERWVQVAIDSVPPIIEADKENRYGRK